MAPIRVLHFADVHIGMENYGKVDAETGISSRVRDFVRRLDEMIAYAAEHDVDLVVFAGDAFKSRSPDPTFQREFAHRVRDLATLAPVVLLVGNHDLPMNIVKASSVEIYDTLSVPNVWVAAEYEVRVISTKRGPVAVGAAPYPLRAKLLAGQPVAGSIAAVDDQMNGMLLALLERLASEADAHGDMPRLLTAHFTVGGAVLGSERQVMLGRDVSVPLSALADPRWDYVALGHVHKHQNLTAKRPGDPPVVYSGSLERIDFGEEGDPKGFCWVELARGGTTWQFQRVAARPFVTLDMDLRTSANPTDDIYREMKRHDLTGAVVRLRLKLSQASADALNEGAIRSFFKQANAFALASVYKDLERPERLRLGASPEGLTPVQLLERYLLSRQVPRERIDQLLEMATPIFETHG